ncbi:MAG: hypothetical protein H6576_13940 [Lewinellaceae bacterium]|nr:hypothetical protein [Lewinellaceae bacterium]
MKRLFITLSIILLFVTNSLTAQSGDISVIRVEFFSPVEGLDYWVRIKEDGLSNIELSGPNKTKAWMLNSDGSILKKPVAYVSGSTPRISACFKIAGSNGNCRNANGQAVPVKYFAKADILDEFGTPLGMELPSKQLVKSGSNTVFEYLTEAITSIFEKNKTRYFDQFKISWKWSRSIDGPWEDAGTTDNRLYVTHAKPIYPGSLASPIFHTCLYLGCVAANNQTQDQNVFDEINQEFATKCIKRVDDPEGNCLNYYGDPILTRQNRGLEYLLENASGSAYEDGRCNEWVDFLTETINAQG